MTDCTVDGCPRPTTDFLCNVHRDDLVAALKELANGLMKELDITRWKLSRSMVNTGATSRSATSALMFHSAASDLFWTARDTIYAWVKIFKKHNPQLHPPGASANPAECAAWLATFPNLLALQDDAGQMVDEITYVVREVKRTIDCQPAHRYLGVCSAPTEEGSCERDLYAPAEKAYVTCRECGTLHDTGERRQVLLDAVGGQKGTVSELARALPDLLGRPISVESVRTWVRKGELIAVGKNDRGHSLFMVDDLVNLVITKQTRIRGKVTTVVVSA